MFPDSQIAQKMWLETNKLKYMVNHGIAPYVKDILRVLRDDVKKSDWYVVSFDESMNDITQASEMGFHLSAIFEWWDKQSGR